jgi:hypothetical protein
VTDSAANKMADETGRSTRRQTRRVRVHGGDGRHSTRGGRHGCPEYEAVTDSASHKATYKVADSTAHKEADVVERESTGEAGHSTSQTLVYRNMHLVRVVGGERLCRKRQILVIWVVLT